MKPTLALAALLISSALPALAKQAPPEDPGPALAEKLLHAMGGRDAWAAVTFVHVEARHDDLDISEPFVNRIWNDLKSPRVRFWAGNGEFTRARRIEGGVGMRELGPEAGARLTEAQYQADRAWWEANVYRTFHRMAKRDTSLTYRAPGPFRLEVLNADGTVLNWFVVNRKGEPMLFGAGGDERGTAFGPLASSGSVRYPKWGARADGSWRYEIVRFQAEAVAPRDAFLSPLPPESRSR
ncbi:MAG: hypothetical protein K1Y01_15165 [Vicinamibacteria bacterium]|nr:hypothetical protein [Vicinamibacteria bacterium]